MSHHAAPATLLKEEPSLPEFTEGVRRNQAISWYRTKLTAAQVKELHAKSNWRGACQTLGYLGILVAAATATFYSAGHWHWWITAVLCFAYAMVIAFAINGVHELGHQTVFRTRELNTFFCHVLAFLGWINHETFQSSHIRHHRYTLHPPDDLEVVLPLKMVIWHLFRDGVVDPGWLWRTWKTTWRIATGGFEGDWELTLYPETAREKRLAPVHWAQALLLGHGVIMVVSLCLGWWMVPVVVSLAPCAGHWLFSLCNNTQHVGLQDNVSDFRLCCRTFTLNPFVRFLYWQMNYHIEHHMYAAVPCYHLGRLHRLIRHDLPPTPDGLVAVWRDIGAILARQTREPGYQYVVALPSAAKP